MAVRKVLCHINSLCRGGAERVMSVLVNSMIEDDIEVTLVTLSKDDNEYPVSDKVKRIVVDEVNSYSSGIDRLIKRHMSLRRYIKAERPDLVLSFTVNENYRAAISMLGMNIPLLVSVRNDPKVSYAGHKLITSYMQRKAAGCVFQTTSAKQFFSSKFQDKSTLILNPLDDKYLNNIDEHKKYLESKTASEFVICNVGRISRQKNQIMLVKAIAEVKKKYSNVIVKIFGDDFEKDIKEELIKTINDYELGDTVKLMGLSDRIEHELARTDIFVLSSDYEGMPNALMEAMATGLAVISTDCPCGGPADLVEDRINGMLVPVGDYKAAAQAICDIIESTELREKLGNNATKLCDIANKEAIYKQWKEYMESLI